MVARRWGRASFEVLTAPPSEVAVSGPTAGSANGLGLAAQWKEYAGMGHSACPEELADLATFLRDALNEAEPSRL